MLEVSLWQVPALRDRRVESLEQPATPFIQVQPKNKPENATSPCCSRTERSISDLTSHSCFSKLGIMQSSEGFISDPKDELPQNEHHLKEVISLIWPIPFPSRQKRKDNLQKPFQPRRSLTTSFLSQPQKRAYSIVRHTNEVYFYS